MIFRAIIAGLLPRVLHPSGRITWLQSTDTPGLFAQALIVVANDYLIGMTRTVAAERCVISV